jgi:hypothetical protein
MEAISSTPLVADQVYYGLPERFIEMRNLYVDSSPYNKLEYRTPEQLIIEYPTTTSELAAYTITDGQIKLNAPATSGNLMMSYWRRFEFLTEAAPTGYYTSEAPDVLLHTALIQAEQYVVDPEKIQIWREQANIEVQGLNRLAVDQRYGGDTLQVRLG